MASSGPVFHFYNMFSACLLAPAVMLQAPERLRECLAERLADNGTWPHPAGSVT